MSLDFDSQITIGEEMQDFTQEQVKNEPMLFSCDFMHAYAYGDVITRNFLDLLEGASGKAPDCIIDSRVHMLMPGWWPCIPGWHHDDVPRSREDGQPNYYTPEYKSKHVLALINGNVCPTEFAIGKCTMPEVPLGEVIYRTWHKEVEKLVRSSELNVIKAPSNKLVYFDNETFHQGTQAVGNGWRWFGRASFNTQREAKNEIRRQVQVYVDFPFNGW